MRILILILAFITQISCIKEEPIEKLQKAIRKGNIKEVESLVLKYSINLNDPTLKYKPLSIATMRNNIEMVKKLIELGANINEINQKGHTPLHLASGWGKPEMVEFLLKNGANIKARDYISWTPLMWAAIRGRIENAEILLKYGDDPNSVDLDKNTPLILAAYRNQKNMIFLLLKYGANKDSKNVYNETFCDVLKKRNFIETANYFSCF